MDHAKPRSELFIGQVGNQRGLFDSLEEIERQLNFVILKDHGLLGASISAPRPLYIIGKPVDNAPVCAGNGQMVALLASSLDMVNRIYKTALPFSRLCEGLPRLRAHYHEDYYAARFPGNIELMREVSAKNSYRLTRNARVPQFTNLHGPSVVCVECLCTCCACSPLAISLTTACHAGADAARLA